MSDAPHIEDVVDVLPRLAEPPPLREWSRYVLHHTDGRGDPWAIARWHVHGNRWPTIGYHFVLHGGTLYLHGGTLYQTARLNERTYHAGAFNETAIGIAIVGNYDARLPHPNDTSAAARLIAHLMRWRRHLDPGEPMGRDQIPRVCGHREVRFGSAKLDDYGWPKKSCPGRAIDMGAFRSTVLEELSSLDAISPLSAVARLAKAGLNTE